MAKGRSRYQRTFGNRRYKKLFIIAPEGRKTEPNYFYSVIRRYNSNSSIKVITGKASSPNQVLKRIRNFQKQNHMKSKDESWIVLDKDEWLDTQMDEINRWTNKKKNFLALSNPNFEYWLLLHFEDGNGIGSKRELKQRLNKFLPCYQKDIDKHKFPYEAVQDAIIRASKQINSQNDTTLPFGSTTVFMLVKQILNT